MLEVLFVKTRAGCGQFRALPSLEATWAHVVKMAAYHPPSRHPAKGIIYMNLRRVSSGKADTLPGSGCKR